MGVQLNTQNYILDLRESGMISTTELARHFGLSCLPATFIVNTLGIRPALVVRSGQAYYWNSDQVNQIRNALIAHLLKIDVKA